MNTDNYHNIILFIIILDTYSDDVDHYSKLGQKIILTFNKEKKKYTLGINSYFVYNSNKTCDEKKNN